MHDDRLSIFRGLRHPLHAWRHFTQATADRADAQARAAGLTVEVLPRGVHRYRDPRLDQLATATTRHITSGQGWSPVTHYHATIDGPRTAAADAADSPPGGAGAYQGRSPASSRSAHDRFQTLRGNHHAVPP